MEFGHPHCYFEEPPLRLIKDPVAVLKGWIRLPAAPQRVTLEIAGRPHRLKLAPREDLANAFPLDWAQSFKTALDTVRFSPLAQGYSLPWTLVVDGLRLESGVLHIPKLLLENPAPGGFTAFEREAKAMWLKFDVEPVAWLDHPGDRVLRRGRQPFGGWVRLDPEIADWTIRVGDRIYETELFERQDVAEALQLPGRIVGFWAHPEPEHFTGDRVEWALAINGEEVHGGVLRVER